MKGDHKGSPPTYLFFGGDYTYFEGNVNEKRYNFYLSPLVHISGYGTKRV